MVIYMLLVTVEVLFLRGCVLNVEVVLEGWGMRCWKGIRSRKE